MNLDVCLNDIQLRSYSYLWAINQQKYADHLWNSKLVIYHIPDPLIPQGLAL